MLLLHAVRDEPAGFAFNRRAYKTLPDGHWLRAIKARLRRHGVREADDLFIYRAKTTGLCVLALRKRESAVAVWSLGEYPCSGKAAPPAFEFILSLLRPVRQRVRDYMEAQRVAEWETSELKRCAEEEREDKIKHFKKRGRDDVVEWLKTSPYSLN